MAKAGNHKVFKDSKQKMSDYTLERRVQAYPSQLFRRFVHAMAEHNDSSVSDVVCDAIKQYYNSLDPKERSQIMQGYDLRQRLNRQSKNSY